MVHLDLGQPVKISTEIAKVFPRTADIGGMGMYSVQEVASRIGVGGRRVREIAFEHSIGRIIGNTRIFTEEEIEQVRWYTRRGKSGRSNLHPDS